ncbi:PAB-dependent poly-A-specific ribonuclease subunit PAN2 [Clavulina sp. PMI_390]|nr:PAB-dependent poly-A-specific ribonuclease subunit PAN2 [Clavulina sp. PMI_390]
MKAHLYHAQPSFGARFPFPQPITSLSFDPVADTLWSGNAGGSVHAYHGSTRMRGVSYIVCRGEVIERVLASDNVVHACSRSNVGSWGKGGVNKWTHKPEKPAVTFEHHPTRPHTLVVALAAPEFLQINSATGSVVRTTSVPSIVSHLRASPTALISGASDGVLRLHDVRNSAARNESMSEISVLAHVAGITGLEVSGNMIYTIGYSVRRQPRPLPDANVKLFDVRMLRPLPPIPFTDGPGFINVHPKKSTILTITSAGGAVHVVDTTKPSEFEYHMLPLSVGSFVTAAAASPDGSYLAFGDAEGSIHILSSADDAEQVPFNGFEGKPIEWPDPVEPLPDITWADKTPLNTIGMPYYDKELLSFYEPPLAPVSTGVPPPAKIPPQILSSVRIQDHLKYAVMPKELRGRRNMVKLPPKRKEGHFRSELTRRNNDPSTGPLSPQNFDAAHPEVPSAYHRVDIMYSKFGVEDFNFERFNKTNYSGLESHIPNSYANSLIQILHYCDPIRHVAKSHITTACRSEPCMLCEFGFVVRMLEDARGINLQARNFCVAIGKTKSAQTFPVVDRSVDGEGADYASMIQQLNRILIEDFTTEGNAFPQNPHIYPPLSTTRSIDLAGAPITQLLGVDARNVTICAVCGYRREKEQMSHVVDLVYPRKQNSGVYSFASILRSSIEREVVYKSTCQTCRNLSNHRSRRVLSSRVMPPVLAVNAAVANEEHFRCWIDGHSSRFLQPSVTLSMRDPDGGLELGSDESVTYDLRGYVAEIRVGKIRHLVSVINSKEQAPLEDEDSGWHLFNDFLVRKIPQDEALSFPGHWKVPCILYYERRDTLSVLDYAQLPQTLDPSILTQRISLATHVNWNTVKHEVLSMDEIPTPGTVIAIDAEFVDLVAEESEIRSDGTKTILKPSQKALARVSVVRGEGPKKGIAFIDDYIHTSDTVTDYLTAFSGIQPGDLHPSYSTHVLLPLKAVYKKLRLLVDLGCIFVGHGLKNDFRTINIFVPPEQVKDTVEGYLLHDSARRLKLRFLMYLLFKQDIQVETHDSIEDARAALQLYDRMNELDPESFHDLVREIYAEGKKLNYQAPEPPKPAAVPSPAPPTMPFMDPTFQMRAGAFNPQLAQMQIQMGMPLQNVFRQPGGQPGMIHFPGNMLPPWATQPR